MPLIKSASKKAIGKNIAKEKAAGKPKDQAIAIALDVARTAAKKTAGPAPKNPAIAAKRPGGY